jgi:hypothetical protein
MEIRPVGAELFHVDGQTDMSKLIAILRTCLKIPPSAHTVYFMCFVWISEQTAIISLYSIN